MGGRGPAQKLCGPQEVVAAKEELKKAAGEKGSKN